MSNQPPSDDFPRYSTKSDEETLEIGPDTRNRYAGEPRPEAPFPGPGYAQPDGAGSPQAPVGLPDAAGWRRPNGTEGGAEADQPGPEPGENGNGTSVPSHERA